jgi:hypothetical protein
MNKKTPIKANRLRAKQARAQKRFNIVVIVLLAVAYLFIINSITNLI